MDRPIEEVVREVADVHYRHLFSYVILIEHEDEDNGAESVGAGVLVGIGGRHFIATAAHCVRRNPRVMRDEMWDEANRNLVPRRDGRILRTVCHPTLDLAFLEVSEALRPEMSEGQLALTPPGSDWALHVVGYPVRSRAKYEQLKLNVIAKRVFVSSIAEQSDDYIRLRYPIMGQRLKGDHMVDHPFIETPHGFSGGGCFGITATPNEITGIRYRLIGIQACWFPGKRTVEVVPVRHWLEMVKACL
jgi:hypothetical protein